MNINEFQEWFESTFWEYSAKFNGDVARIPAEQGFAKAAWKAACELKDKDLKKLGEVINAANTQTEHFEREWYLRGDEIEALRAELDAFKAENIALRKVWGERCEELDAIKSARPDPAIPDRYVLVPVEPTDEMMSTWRKLYRRGCSARDCIFGMIAASQKEVTP